MTARTTAGAPLHEANVRESGRVRELHERAAEETTRRDQGEGHARGRGSRESSRRRPDRQDHLLGSLRWEAPETSRCRAWKGTRGEANMALEGARLLDRVLGLARRARSPEVPQSILAVSLSMLLARAGSAEPVASFVPPLPDVHGPLPITSSSFPFQGTGTLRATPVLHLITWKRST
jgi:hypothetical protein